MGGISALIPVFAGFSPRQVAAAIVYRTKSEKVAAIAGQSCNGEMLDFGCEFDMLSGQELYCIAVLNVKPQTHLMEVV